MIYLMAMGDAKISGQKRCNYENLGWLFVVPTFKKPSSLHVKTLSIVFLSSDHRLAQWSAASEQWIQLAWRNWYRSSDLKSSVPIISRQQHRQLPGIQRRQWGQGPICLCFHLCNYIFLSSSNIHFEPVAVNPWVIAPHRRVLHDNVGRGEKSALLPV